MKTQKTKGSKKAETKAAKASKSAKQPKEARSGSKKEIVLELLRREGATLAEIAKATDWQNTAFADSSAHRSAKR